MDAQGVTGLSILGAIAVATGFALAAALGLALLSGRPDNIFRDVLAGLAGAVLLGLVLPMRGVPISRSFLEGLIMTAIGAALSIALARLVGKLLRRNPR